MPAVQMAIVRLLLQTKLFVMTNYPMMDLLVPARNVMRALEYATTNLTTMPVPLAVASRQRARQPEFLPLISGLMVANTSITMSSSILKLEIASLLFRCFREV